MSGASSSANGSNNASRSAGPEDSSARPYVPQLSEATQRILERMRAGAGAGGSSGIVAGGYEDARRSVLSNMKTTLNMEVDSPGANNETPRRGSGTGNKSIATKGRSNSIKGKNTGVKAGTKRKRFKKESESADEDEDEVGAQSGSDGEFAAVPTMTKSGRQVSKPTQFDPAASETPPKRRGGGKRTQEQALCKRCGRGHSPASNMIVFCDGCNLGWHQMCHDPHVPTDAVKDESKAWFCGDCISKRTKKAIADVSRGVSWQSKSMEEKRQYLSTLSHQTLVSLLLRAATLHPELPIFPSSLPTVTHTTLPPAQPSGSEPRRFNVYPQQPFPPSATAGLFPRAESNPNAPINFIRKIPTGASTPNSSFVSVSQFSPAPERHDGLPRMHDGLPRVMHDGLPRISGTPSSRATATPNRTVSSLTHSNSAPPDAPATVLSSPLRSPDNPKSDAGTKENSKSGEQSGNAQGEAEANADGDADNESRESTPASPPYPRPGSGLMAKLPPDDQDLDWLVDANDYGSFNHMMFNRAGEKVEENGVGVGE